MAVASPSLAQSKALLRHHRDRIFQDQDFLHEMYQELIVHICDKESMDVLTGRLAVLFLKKAFCYLNLLQYYL